MKKIGLITAICLSFSTQMVFAQNNITTYKTELGSTLELQIDSGNILSGSFTSAVSSKQCQQIVGIKKPVVGYVINNAISFSTYYTECNAVISFVGYFIKDGNSIDTTSIIVRDSSTNPGIPGERSLNNVMFNRV